MTKSLKVIPLGGLGEIGRNMAVFEYAGRMLIVDCGILFPEESQPGVDLILPDFDYLSGRLDEIEALVVTHAHEDHIGAIPFLLKLREDIPIVGSALTLALIAAKCQEHRIKPNLVTVREGETYAAGDFNCEFIAVSHSIPDALAVAIRTPAGNVLHTGDFKMDQLPLDGRITDLRAFARLADEGLDLFMVDSTNAEVPGFNISEREIGPVLDNAFSAAKHRIIVSSFASHIHRIQQVLDLAHKHGRKVAFVGRSMVRNMGIAAELGYLQVPEGLLVELDQLADLPEDETILVCTGSQGEENAALARIANQDHKIEVEPGDTVILASSLVPGNETQVGRIINKLINLGVHVVHQANAKVHVSGHATAGELLYVYNILKPKNVLPVHGEFRHLVANGELAKQTGVPAERVLLASSGSVIELKDGRAEIIDSFDPAYIYVEGRAIGELTETDLKDRRILNSEGFISVFATVDIAARKVAVGPHIEARGFAESSATFTSAEEQITKALEEAMAQGEQEQNKLQQIMRRTLGRWVNRKYRRRPMIVPVLVLEDE